MVDHCLGSTNASSWYNEFDFFAGFLLLHWNVLAALNYTGVMLSSWFIGWTAMSRDSHFFQIAFLASFWADGQLAAAEADTITELHKSCLVLDLARVAWTRSWICYFFIWWVTAIRRGRWRGWRRRVRWGRRGRRAAAEPTYVKHEKLINSFSRDFSMLNAYLLEESELEDDDEDDDEESPARRTGFRPASLSLITLPYNTFSFKQVACWSSRWRSLACPWQFWSATAHEATNWLSRRKTQFCGDFMSVSCSPV